MDFSLLSSMQLKTSENIGSIVYESQLFLPVMQATSTVDVLFFCRNRFGFNPGKCFSRVDCVSGLKGVRAPHDDADNIEYS